MSADDTLLAALTSGIAAGAMLAVALVLWRSALAAAVRFTALGFGLSIAAWLITESNALNAALGPAHVVVLLIAYPVSGLFWLFIRVVFDDRPITPLDLAPPVLLLLSGPLLRVTQPPVFDLVWYARNGFGGLLAIHAGLVIIRGWRGDLVEGRRRVRAILFGLSCAYAVLLVSAGFIYRVNPEGPWLMISPGREGGGLIVAALAMAMALLTLQARPTTFGASRRADTGPDPRAEAAERVLTGKLDELMGAGAWRREGLTIGALAGELGEPEHRLRRLINQRLGHRNFADFVNGYRIEAAKARLGDPNDARTTVAAIAFDLGYGSLGPFNRAFRAATGVTPTEWRRQALQASPELQEAL